MCPSLRSAHSLVSYQRVINISLDGFDLAPDRSQIFDYRGRVAPDHYEFAQLEQDDTENSETDYWANAPQSDGANGFVGQRDGFQDVGEPIFPQSISLPDQLS